MPGKGRRSEQHRRAARRACTSDGRRAALRRAAWAAASARASSSACRGCSRRSRAARSPFAAGAELPRGRVFCEPRLVVEVEFREWTAGGQPAPADVQGPARGQAGGAGRARGRRPRSEPAARARAATAIAARATSRARDGRRPRAEAVEPRQGAVPAGGLHQGRADRVLRGDRAGAARPPGRAAADGHALARRRARRSRSSRSRRPRTAPSGCATVDACPSAAQQADRLHAGRRTCRRSCGWRTWPRSSCTCRWRAREAIERPTALVFDLDPGRAGDDRRVLPRRAAAARHVRAPGPGELRQDVGLEGPAGLCAAERRRRRPTSRPSRSRKAVARAARAAPNRTLVVSRMTKARARRQGADRLEPERRTEDDGVRRTRCAPASARPSRRRSNGTRCALRATPETRQPRVRGRRGARARGRARRPVRAGAVARAGAAVNTTFE